MRSGQVSRLHRSAEKNITSDRQRTKIKSAKQGDQKKISTDDTKTEKTLFFPFLRCLLPLTTALPAAPQAKPPLSFGTPSAFLLRLCINHDNALNLLPPTFVLKTCFRFLRLFFFFPRYSARKIKLHLSSFRKRIPRPQTIATTLPARPRPFTDPPANR